ncbi:hypothetical protein EYZ11_005253 [Aspergillus tanneri]|nr:hypothetical protein EYZ11_005253 [Aspergillus tanneri]
METFGLLPSPPLSESKSSQPSPSSTYFSPKSQYDSDTDHGTPKSCAINPEPKPSYAYSAPKLKRNPVSKKSSDGPTNVRMAHSNLIRQCESDDGKLTPVSIATESMSSMSPTPPSDVDTLQNRKFSGSSMGSLRSRSMSVSSEGSWVPSSLSQYKPWLQPAPAETTEAKGERSKEFNWRKCQIVPPSDKPLVLAVASKTKPKLVDISRQSSPAISYSIPTPPPRPIPSTPDHRQHEISAFSPETPMEMSDSGYITHDSYYSPQFRKDREEDEYTDSSSLTSGSASETVVCDKPSSSQERLKSPQKPGVTPKTQPSPKSQTSPGHSSNMSEKEELEKWWDHEWTIDQLEHSVKDFPRHMLKLTSPVIMFLRHNNEKALIRPFRKIFPDVVENLLDSLCAALIARNYLTSLSSPNRRNSNFSHKTALSRLDTVPEKVCSTLGIQYSQPSPSRVKNRILGTRSADLCKDLDRIVDNLLFAICGKQDEILKSAVLVLAHVLETKS